MVADWKIVSVGGGCTCWSSQVHQPNTELCQRFCFDKMTILSGGAIIPGALSTCAEEVREEFTTLQVSL